MCSSNWGDGAEEEESRREREEEEEGNEDSYLPDVEDEANEG